MNLNDIDCEIIYKSGDSELIDAVSKSSYNSCLFAQFIIKNKLGDVPKSILWGISDSSSESLEYALFLFEKRIEVPTVILRGISNSSSYSADYASFLIERNEDIPPEIMNGLLRNTESAYNTSQNFIWRSLPVPEEILNAIARSPGYSYMYCSSLVQYTSITAPSEKRGDVKIPESIVDGISKSSNYSLHYANLLMDLKKEVPQKIIKAISPNMRERYGLVVNESLSFGNYIRGAYNGI